MDQIDELFSDANAVATREVAATFDMSEADAREWADELEVSKIGASFAWTRPDVEALSDALDELESDSKSETESDDDTEDDESDDEEADEDE